MLSAFSRWPILVMFFECFQLYELLLLWMCLVGSPVFWVAHEWQLQPLFVLLMFLVKLCRSLTHRVYRKIAQALLRRSLLWLSRPYYRHFLPLPLLPLADWLFGSAWSFSVPLLRILACVSMPTFDWAHLNSIHEPAWHVAELHPNSCMDCYKWDNNRPGRTFPSGHNDACDHWSRVEHDADAYQMIAHNSGIYTVLSLVGNCMKGWKWSRHCEFTYSILRSRDRHEHARPILCLWQRLSNSCRRHSAHVFSHNVVLEVIHIGNSPHSIFHFHLKTCIRFSVSTFLHNHSLSDIRERLLLGILSHDPDICIALRRLSLHPAPLFFHLLNFLFLTLFARFPFLSFSSCCSIEGLNSTDALSHWTSNFNVEEAWLPPASLDFGFEPMIDALSMYLWDFSVLQRIHSVFVVLRPVYVFRTSTISLLFPFTLMCRFIYAFVRMNNT